MDNGQNENTVQNSIYKIINSNNEHSFKNYLTANRGIRNYSQNKVGHHDQSMGHSVYTQRTFLYQALNIYNKLPRELTLIKQNHLFKKWCQLYNLNNKIKLKDQNDNIIIYSQNIDNNIILECQNSYKEP